MVLDLSLTDSVMRHARDLVDSQYTDLPLPGSGRTVRRWRALAAATRDDVVTGRLVEAHVDAMAIMAELDHPIPSAGGLWGVWAADPPSGRLTATRHGTGWRVDGTKEWCSGAGGCSRALVTAHAPDGYRLFAVDLDRTRDAATAVPVADTWSAIGMSRSDSRSVRFEGAPAVAVGDPDAYLTRAGFWHGAVGVAAAWYGGARGVADLLVEAHRARPLDAHALAHAGAVDADLRAARASLIEAADQIDADPQDSRDCSRARALAVRAVVEGAASRTLEHVGRALGPVPLARHPRHAQRVADLGVYLRQSHAESDLETLGRDTLDRSAEW